MVHANDLERRQSELKSIQTQINKQQSALKNTSQQRESLISLLRKDEKAIALAARKVNETKKNLQQTDKKLAQLSSKHSQLDKLKTVQQKSLANQLASAYLAGNHDYSKMLLNQQSPASIERLLAYYEYLNNARIASIKQLQTTLKDLNQVQQQQQQNQDRLNKLVLEQQQ